MLTTTLRLLREHNACSNRYEYLSSQLGAAWDDHEPISLIKIMDINGISDALWALRAVPYEQTELRDKLARVFVIACVRRTPIPGGRTVWDLLSDPRSRNAVEVAERFVVGEATRDELRAAYADAYAAAYAYAYAAAAAYAYAYADAAYADADAAAYAYAYAVAAARKEAKNAQGIIFKEIFGKEKE